MPPTWNGVTTVPASFKRMTRPMPASATHTRPFAASTSLPLRPATGMLLATDTVPSAARLSLKTRLVPGGPEVTARADVNPLPTDVRDRRGHPASRRRPGQEAPYLVRPGGPYPATSRG